MPTPTPRTLPILSTVATEPSAVDQLAVAARSLVVPSLYRPVAVACSVTPTAMLLSAGEIVIDVRCGALPPPHPQATSAPQIHARIARLYRASDGRD